MNKNKNNLNKNYTKYSNVTWWILGGTSFITLYFNSKVQDPFNSPKFWILLIVTSWLLGHLVKDRGIIFHNKILKYTFNILIFFIGTTLLSFVFTDVKYIAFFGENMRRTGALNYVALSILFLSAATFLRLQNMKRLYSVSFFTGVIVGGYGLLQSSGIDFVQWNNPYNSVISTLGNPNFSAAIMAILGTLVFGPVLNSNYRMFIRLSCFLVSLILLYAIYLSEARQGLIAIALGIGSYSTVYVYSRNRKIGFLTLFSGLTVSFFSILGMLQIGPLTSILYKPSVTVRGYYWRAGIEMVKDHPYFGVGLDRYGAFFKQYRDSTYSLNYGFDITSTNAHNVPIQMFATGGIFVGLGYLGIITFVFLRGLKGIKQHSGNNRLAIASVFSAWLAFQAQSIISIDNIGITAWGWMLGGAIIGLSINDYSLNSSSIPVKQKTNSFSVVQPLVSGSFVLLTVIVVTFLFRSESNMFMQRMAFNPQVEANRAPLRDYALKTINSPLVEPAYRLRSATNLIANNFDSEGIAQLDYLYKIDPRDPELLNYLSAYSEYHGKLKEAIEYRKQIYEFDPWNSKNLLQLGRNYKNLNDFTGMRNCLNKILSFDIISPESKSAQSELIE
jgi:O-antigen ligase